MTINKKDWELKEDIALLQFAAEREQTFDKIEALRHSEVWGSKIKRNEEYLCLTLNQTKENS